MLRVRRPIEPESPPSGCSNEKEHGADVGLVAPCVLRKLVSVAARELGAQDRARQAQARVRVQIGEQRVVEDLVARAVDALRGVAIADVGAAEGLEIEGRRAALRAHLAPRRNRRLARREQRREPLLHPRRALAVRKAAQVLLVGGLRVRELALAFARQAEELERLGRHVALGLLEDFLEQQRRALELSARQRPPRFGHELHGPRVGRGERRRRSARRGGALRLRLHAHHDAA